MAWSISASISIAEVDAANNRTKFNWSVTLGSTSGSVYWYYEYGSASIAGTTVWSIAGRHEQEYLQNGTIVGSGSTWIYHDSNGWLGDANRNVRVDATYRHGYNSNGYGSGGGGTGTSVYPNNLTASSGWVTTSNYDRSPTTPVISEIARSSNGSQITTLNYSGGVNNSGPAVTYLIEYSTVSDFSTIAGTATSVPFNLPSTSTNTAYYFRIKASNTDGTKYSTNSFAYGVPGPPTFESGQGAKPSPSISGATYVSWTHPTNTQTQSPAVPTYDVYRNGVKINTSPVNATSYTDSGLVRGTSYEYTVVAVNGLGYNTTTSRSSAVSSIASGVPAQITGTIGISKVGRNVTVTCGQSPNNYGNIIIGYAVQYSTDNGETWSGGTAMTNRSYQYVLLPPALTYIFRCYAINSIGNGDTLSSTPVFVSAGGRRKLPNGDFEPTQTAKRYDSSRPEGQKWVDLNTAKRYSAAANNGAGDWVDLS